MSDISFKFVGWCKQEHHDKIWVSFSVGKNYYCAWGRRGKKLQFKQHPNIHSLNKIQEQKEKKGYKPVDELQLFTLFPNFENDIDAALLISTLAGTVR